MISAKVHPMLRVVERCERLWTDSKEQADNRAAVVLCALIDCGAVAGSTRMGVPLSPPDQDAVL